MKSKKAYLVSLKHELKGHLQLQLASANQVDRRWLNGFMAAGFHSGLISLSELDLRRVMYNWALDEYPDYEVQDLVASA